MVFFFLWRKMLRNSLSSGVRKSRANKRKAIEKAMPQSKSSKQSLKKEGVKKLLNQGNIIRMLTAAHKAMTAERQQEKTVDLFNGKPSRRSRNSNSELLITDAITVARASPLCLKGNISKILSMILAEMAIRET